MADVRTLGSGVERIANGAALAEQLRVDRSSRIRFRTSRRSGCLGEP